MDWQRRAAHVSAQACTRVCVYACTRTGALILKIAYANYQSERVRRVCVGACICAQRDVELWKDVISVGRRYERRVGARRCGLDAGLDEIGGDRAVKGLRPENRTFVRPNKK
jgi:hypothetical protein